MLSRCFFLLLFLIGLAGCGDNVNWFGTGEDKPGAQEEEEAVVGIGNDFLNRPRAIATDEVYLYVVDIEDGALVKMSRTGTLAWKIDGSADLADPFLQPRGVAVDEFGSVYVLDTGNHRIVKVSPSGNVLAHWGSEPGEDDDFYFPAGVAVVDDNVYVSEGGAEPLVRAYSLDGVFLRSWSYEGITGEEFSGELLIAANGAEPLLLDQQLGAVLLPTGETLPTGEREADWFGGFGSGAGDFGEPMGLLVDEGRIYVGDNLRERVIVFSLAKTLLGEVSTVDGDAEPLSSVSGVAIMDGELFVCEEFEGRVRRMEIPEF